MQVVKLNKEILYNPEDATFRSASDPKTIIITLDNLETCVFNDLLNAHGQLVTYEALFEHWQDKIVTDGVLSRVISSIRGKLKKLGLADTKVTNVSKKGYKLDGELEWLSYDTDPSSDVKHIKTVNVLYAGLFVIGIVVFITVLLLFIFKNYESSKEDLAFKHFKYVLSNAEEKYGLAVSPSNSRITYASRSENNLWAQTLYDLNFSVGMTITDGLNHVLGGQFVDDNRLLIYSLNDTECTIKEVSLDFESLSFELTNFTGCNRGGVGMHLAPWNDNEVFYLESVSSTISANVYKANLQTGQSSLVDIDTQNLGMIYGVYAEENCNQLAILSSFEKEDNRVSIIDLDKAGREVWAQNVPETLHSVSWDCKRLVYKDSVGSLFVHQFDEGDLLQSTNIPVLGNYYNPVKISDGIALIKGIERTASITIEDNQGYRNLTESSVAKQKLPRYWDDSTILYWSNEKGHWQLNQVNLSTRKRTLISEFIGHSDIRNFVASQEQNLIAVQTNGVINILKLSEGLDYLEPITEFEGINPYFFRNQIVYARKDESITNLYMRDISTGDEKLIVAGGHSAIVKNGELYFDYWSKLGLWKYNENGSHELHYEISFEFLRFVETDNNFIVISLTGDYYELTPEGPKKLTFSKLNWLREVRNGTSLGVAHVPETTSVFFAKWRQ